MALLYEKSVLWRRLVHATRDRRALAVYVAASVAGASALAWGVQAVTDGGSRRTFVEMEKVKKRDSETARYAKHSKEALGIMIDTVKDGGRDEEKSTGGKQRISLPGVAWHPKAVEREQRATKETRGTPAVAVGPVSSSASTHGPPAGMASASAGVDQPQAS
jgi:hypothetical protein